MNRDFKEKRENTWSDKIDAERFKKDENGNTVPLTMSNDEFEKYYKAQVGAAPAAGAPPAPGPPDPPPRHTRDRDPGDQGQGPRARNPPPRTRRRTLCPRGSGTRSWRRCGGRCR